MHDGCRESTLNVYWWVWNVHIGGDLPLLRIWRAEHDDHNHDLKMLQRILRYICGFSVQHFSTEPWTIQFLLSVVLIHVLILEAAEMDTFSHWRIMINVWRMYNITSKIKKIWIEIWSSKSWTDKELKNTYSSICHHNSSFLRIVTVFEII
jgi:hypothetical protein